MDRIETSVGELQSSVRVLRAANANDRVRFNNSLKANIAQLHFAFDRDGNPWPADVEQPPTLLDLAVAGTMAKLGSATSPTGTRRRARQGISQDGRGRLQVGVDGWREGESRTQVADGAVSR